MPNLSNDEKFDKFGVSNYILSFLHLNLIGTNSHGLGQIWVGFSSNPCNSSLL